MKALDFVCIETESNSIIIQHWCQVQIVIGCGVHVHEFKEASPDEVEQYCAGMDARVECSGFLRETGAGSQMVTYSLADVKCILLHYKKPIEDYIDIPSTMIRCCIAAVGHIRGGAATTSFCPDFERFVNHDYRPVPRVVDSTPVSHVLAQGDLRAGDMVTFPSSSIKKYPPSPASFFQALKYTLHNDGEVRTKLLKAGLEFSLKNECLLPLLS